MIDWHTASGLEILRCRCTMHDGGRTCYIRVSRTCVKPVALLTSMYYWTALTHEVNINFAGVSNTYPL